MENDANFWANILLPGLIGLAGVMFSIPINALFAWYLKRDEQNYQLKLDSILEDRKKRLNEIELRDKVKMLKKDVDEIKMVVKEIQERLENG